MSTVATFAEPTIEEVKRNVRVEDKLKLRELELHTQYELKYLSDSFTDLKRFVKDKLDNETDRFDVLNKKVNWLMYIILAQLAGVDASMLAGMAKYIPV